jgi:hypothetical protein
MLLRIANLIYNFKTIFKLASLRRAVKEATVIAQPELLRNRAERRAGHRLN